MKSILTKDDIRKFVRASRDIARLKFNESNHLTWFVGVISNTGYQEHAKRQGRDPKEGLEGGIGLYIPGGTDIWHWI